MVGASGSVTKGHGRMSHELEGENSRGIDLRHRPTSDLRTDLPTGSRRPGAFGEPLADPARLFYPVEIVRNGKT